MLREDVLQQDLVDQLGGAGLGLVLLQLLLPGVVQQVDVLVLSVQDQEVEEESNEESKVRQVALISVRGPNLVAETLTLDTLSTQMVGHLIIITEKNVLVLRNSLFVCPISPNIIRK